MDNRRADLVIGIGQQPGGHKSHLSHLDYCPGAMRDLSSGVIRELPDMMSAKIPDFYTPSSLSSLGSDSNYKIHATSLITSAFP